MTGLAAVPAVKAVVYGIVFLITNSFFSQKSFKYMIVCFSGNVPGAVAGDTGGELAPIRRTPGGIESTLTALYISFGSFYRSGVWFITIYTTLLDPCL